MSRASKLGARSATAAPPGAASSPPGCAGPTSTIVASAPTPAAAATAASAASADRLLDLALELLVVGLVARLRLVGTADLELLLGQLGVRHGVLERRRGPVLAVIVGLVGHGYDGLVIVLERVANEVVPDRIRREVDGFQLRSVTTALELGATVVVLVLSCAVVDVVRRGRQPLARIGRRPRLARPPLSGAFAVAGHGALRSAQRVSRCAVWHLHQRQYLRSWSRSGLFRLLLLVW